MSKLLNVVSLAIILLTALVLWQLNTQTHFCSDDYLYSFKFNPDFANGDSTSPSYQRISGFEDYCSSLSALYKTLTGRIVAHGILQFMLMLPGWIFDLLNTIVFLALTYLYSTWVAGRKHKARIPVWPLCTMLFYLSISVSQRNVYFPAFSCNYIWTQLIVFMFLIPVRWLIQEDHRQNRGWAFAVLMFFMGLIAGDTNEPLVPGVLLAMGTYAGYCLIKKPRQLPRWYFWAMLGLLLGFMILLLAPGNSGRSSYETAKTGVRAIGFSLNNLRFIAFDMIRAIPLLILGILGLSGINLDLIKQNWPALLFVLNALAGTLFALLIPPIYSSRMSILLLGVLLVICLRLFMLSWGHHHKALTLCTLLVSVMFGFRLMKDHYWVNSAYQEYHLFREQIDACPLDSCLVNPRAYHDALTAENWAKPVATYYNKRHLWIKDPYAMQTRKNWKAANYTRAQTLGDDNIEMEGLYYVNHDAYSRTLYVSLKSAKGRAAVDSLGLALKTADLPDAMEAVALSLPTKLLYYLLPPVIIYRYQPGYVNNNEAVYSISMPIVNGREDILCIDIKKKGRTIKSFFVYEVEFPF